MSYIVCGRFHGERGGDFGGFVAKWEVFFPFSDFRPDVYMNIAQKFFFI